MRLEANPYNFKRCLPRMVSSHPRFALLGTHHVTQSWSPKNLYNLWRRSNQDGDMYLDARFDHLPTLKPLFQQRWKSKTLTRAYHGDHINEKIFRRWYVPKTLPDVSPKSTKSLSSIGLKQWARKDDVAQQERKRLEEEQKKGVAPVGSLMYTEVERRLDVLIFRACFAPSVYEARRMVVHGDVLLNGVKHTNANTRLTPGDMISVDPKAIRFLQAKAKPKAKPVSESEDTSEESTEESPKESSEDTEKASEADSERVVKDSRYTVTPFNLPPYASPWLFVPAYLEVSFATCSAVFLRLPTARPEYSEIPTPFDADGEIMRLSWEWYADRHTRIRSKRQLARMPENRGFVAPTTHA
ncbi:hypothetical protein EIP86_006618 [Pleurotus ostreatoroseus]|nr:hypothetical protein EIP86_006618 [Pleurotus ostreatoroseus]